MVHTLDAVTIGGNFDTNNSSFSHTVSAGAGRLLIVTVHLHDNVNVTAVTFDGQSMTEVPTDSPQVSGAGGRVEMWYLKDPNVTTGTVQLTHNTAEGRAVARSFFGSSGTIDVSDGNTGNSASASSGATTTVANCLMVDCAVWGDEDLTGALTGDNNVEDYDAIAGAGIAQRGYASHLLDTGAAAAHTSSNSISGGGESWAHMVAFFKPGADIEQEGFAFGDDDGNEVSHTLDTQDTNIEEAVGVKTLRFLLDSDDDPGDIAYKLKFQKNGTGGYEDVPTESSTVPQAVLTSANITESGNNTATTSWAVSTPDAVEGDLLVFLIAWDDQSDVCPTISAPSGKDGETLLDSGEGVITHGSADARLQVYYVICTGTWTAGTITFTPDASEQWTAAVLKVNKGDFDATTPIGTTGNNTGSGSAPTSPAVTAGASDGGGVWVVFGGVDADPITATPSGYTDISAVDRGAAVEFVSVRDAYVTDSESIGTAAWTISSDSWGTIGLVIRPGAAVTNEVYISASGNVAAGGEATTARLTAPSGKTSGSDFDTGRRWDDENGADSIDITDADYTELEWVLTTQSPATGGDYFEFRVYEGDTAMTTYTLTPKWTIPGGAAGIRSMRQLIGHGQGTRT